MSRNSKRSRIALHRIGRHRFIGVVFLASALPLIGMALYGIRELRIPSSEPMSIKAAAVAPVVTFAPKFIEFVDSFRKNDTITDALMRHGLSKQQIVDLVEAARSVWPRSRVIAGDSFEGNHYPDGEFHEFRYRIDDDRAITIYREEDRFVPVIKNLVFEDRVIVVDSTIRDSLFMAVTDAGEEAQLAIDLANIFTWDVDFYTDIQDGDRFRILLEKKFLEGKFDRYGKILAAELTVGKKQLSAFRFQNEYYDAAGKALKKSHLKSPLKFARISSRFTGARMHPILRIVRPHYGIDYAAPTGTPVAAIATGRVLSAGVNGGYGKSVHLRHDNGYDSIYSHLSSIAVQAGKRVVQGQLIGRVGATGLATGPHLDFRLLKRGVPINPAKAIVPDAPPISSALMGSFKAVRDGLLGQFDRLSSRPKDLASAEGPVMK